MLRSILVFLSVYLIYGLLRQRFLVREGRVHSTLPQERDHLPKKEKEKDWGGTYVTMKR